MSDPGKDVPSDLPIEDLEDLYENAPCGYLSVAPNGRIVKANRTLGAWTGFDGAELVGKHFYDLLNIAGRIFYETHLAPLLRMQGFVNEVALDVTAKDGRKIPVLANAAEKRRNDGRLLFTRLTVFPANDRRRYERDLLSARDTANETIRTERETSELREQFIAVLGHDLRNPLASIASGVRMLEPETLSERGRRILGLMQGSVVRASSLIDDVLDFARGRLGNGIALSLQRDDALQSLLEQVVAELRSVTPHRAIEADIAIEQTVTCDSVRIGQLLSNLLGNAITHGSADQPVRVEAHSDSDRLAIAVSNGGAAIPPHTMERLFQPFFRGEVRGSQNGLGLGLFIASQIAKAHGGDLSVTSTIKETRFTFSMPASAAV
ncbi:MULTISPECIES: PAS domain-containing sensor histidine kinase [unclassified Sphingobium]|uniref:PAS domain-containing sensor histidine kinase n=1 Tax=unclassified Sphingobium TaxID=2611147 RepID=UPI001A2F894A|nr:MULTISPECIES: PAS domain-containing sensor histidine kinase [unclassified Sphingobium]MBG6120240.1 sigma-B regulation protein RsbU (phosphoserine phosphatase) [Sphingobium sp. JAI105]